MSTSAYPNWEEISDKDTEAHKMAVYAAMVDCMDQNIGRIMKTLKTEGIEKNTIVCFLSDNGACSLVLQILTKLLNPKSAHEIQIQLMAIGITYLTLHLESISVWSMKEELLPL